MGGVQGWKIVFVEHPKGQSVLVLFISESKYDTKSHLLLKTITTEHCNIRFFLLSPS